MLHEPGLLAPSAPDEHGCCVLPLIPVITTLRDLFLFQSSASSRIPCSPSSSVASGLMDTCTLHNSQRVGDHVQVTRCDG
ncbi:hypothetical protein BS17DRAFT_127231 [Gyrodon lividus]|nr:hypothetical protein BS17DRAFT_342683 [Gyrodon lividus]KAF9223950.1 hypothetical protein BS17DRAFT_127231 [Gyrodon lividus]